MPIIRKDGTIEYVGLVIDHAPSRSFDLGYDEAYYAEVWDWDTLSPKQVACGSTFPGSHIDKIVPDATPKVLEYYNIYKHNQNVFGERRRIEIEYLGSKKGFHVRVKSGKLVAKGTEGIVISVFETTYGKQLLFEDSAGKIHRTYDKNVETIYIPLIYKPVLYYKKYPDVEFNNKFNKMVKE